MSLLILLPFLISLLTCVGALLYILKRKSLTQSICVQQAAQIQKRLIKPLRQLIRMNPQATILRAKRTAADQSLNSALASGVPYAIAAAKAVKVAVVLEQLAFQAKQLALLTQARLIREEGRQEMLQRVRRLAASPVQTPYFYFRALAVEPKPMTSLSPSYETIPLFGLGQQQRFRFTVDLLARFPNFNFNLDMIQITECSVTLKEKGANTWEVQILTARAP